jgi:hypothetical protein
LLRLNRVYYQRVIYREHKHYRLIETGKYIQKSVRPSREAWPGLDRQSLLAEKHKRFNQEIK